MNRRLTDQEILENMTLAERRARIESYIFHKVPEGAQAAMLARGAEGNNANGLKLGQVRKPEGHADDAS